MENQTAVLEGAAAIAVQKLKEIKAPAEAKAKEEAKVASEKAEKEVQAKKDEGVKLAIEQEARKKDDERILAGEDVKLTEPEKKRKAELQEIKRKEDETPDAKIKRVQEASQKRIDEIKSEMLAKENQNVERLKKLEAELADLKKPKQEEDLKTKIKREHTELIAKYVEEDKAKPKEDRREMTKDELDGWYLEDPTEATAWINRREIRRDRELSKAEEAATKKPQATNEEKLELAKEFARKQNESRAKLAAKYPGTVPSQDKIINLRKSLGLPLDRALVQDELKRLNEKLIEDNTEYKLCMEVIHDNPKFLESTEGPELVMAEMEKRLNKTGKIELTQEEFDAKVQAEIERRKLVDGEGINSTHGGKKVETTAKEKSELRQMQEKHAKKGGISIEQLDKAIERRKKITGVDSGDV